MDSSRPGAESDRFFDGPVGLSILGVAYAAIGIGLFYSLAVDSIALFGAVLVATVAVVVLSLYVLYTREGLLTGENKLIGAFVLVAMGLLFGLSELTELSSEIAFAIVFAVGVGIPWALLEYTDYGAVE